MTRERVAAVVQMAGLSFGIAAGFMVDEALGFLTACVTFLVVGIAMERR
jgi:uncharacterized membrane protein